MASQASTDGSVLMWDMRISNIQPLQLAAPERYELYSIELDNENKIVFAGNRWGRIFAWDLRAVRENIQNNNQTPLLANWDIPEIMSSMPSPKKIEPCISADRIHSIKLNPCCPYQLAFHQENGWSGVLNLFTDTVTHVHCPQATLLLWGHRHYTIRASWLPTCSIYAVGSVCNKYVNLLDFSPDKSSACHIDFEEEQNRPIVGNKAVSISAPVTACLAHPHTTTLIIGTMENPAYARCKDKAFPAYHDIEFLSGKTTATGRHGFTTGMQGDDARSSSSSSPATTALYAQIQQAFVGGSGPGQTSRAQPITMPRSPRNVDVNDTTSCSPTPTPVKRGNPNVSSASGHNSSGKRRRSSTPSRKTTPTSSRKARVEGNPDSIHELVELGKKRLHIAECMLQRELDARLKLHSIEDCMSRLNDVPGLSLEAILSACEALKDERNRSIFMTLSGDILYMWIERQIHMQRTAAGHKPDGPSFPPI